MNNSQTSHSKLDIFYENLSEIFKETEKIYPQIQCKTGCNRCCKFYGSPDVYDFEWGNIKEFIETNFSEKDLRRVYKKLLHGLINLKDSTVTVSDKDSEKFSECPFIYKNSCSIYEKRPFVCRIFGYTKFKEHIMTCSEELNQWENINNNNLPNKDDLEKELLSFDNQSHQYKTMIEWLKGYFQLKS